MYSDRERYRGLIIDYYVFRHIFGSFIHYFDIYGAIELSARRLIEFYNNLLGRSIRVALLGAGGYIG
jgi:hypothetical protein